MGRHQPRCTKAQERALDGSRGELRKDGKLPAEDNAPRTTSDCPVQPVRVSAILREERDRPSSDKRCLSVATIGVTMTFEWDEAKNRSNVRKHSLDFVDAEEMFRGFLLVRPDLRKDYGEERWIGIGMIRGASPLLRSLNSRTTPSASSR